MQSAVLAPMRFSPAAHGFIMPAEYARHHGTWITWPHSEETWRGRTAQAEAAFVQFVNALHTDEIVYIQVLSEDRADNVRRQLQAAGVDLNAIRFQIAPTDCEWIRDYGAIFITHPETQECVATDWVFNNWGHKYDEPDAYPHLEWQNDTPRIMAERHQAERIVLDFVLEGGSLEVDGKGLLLTSESCLLNPNRNPKYTRAEMEQLLCDYLGAQKILWLGDGLLGDETDGHIDNLARFVDSRTILAARETNPQDENFAVLEENWKRLSDMTDLAGQPFQLVALPMPDPLFVDGLRQAATYANFYIGNRTIVMPGYGSPKDEEARQIIAHCYPDRHVVVVQWGELIIGGGSWHCLTQQVPEGFGKAGGSLLQRVEF